jgi:hypothetical protein
VTVRRFDGDGAVQRTISSTATGSNRGSSRNSASWEGFSISSCSPAAMALRVVSAPPENNRLKNDRSSSSVSRAGSSSAICACTTSDSMSVPGFSRRWLIWARPYS